MRTVAERRIKVADEVWVATALLHRENPKQSDFTPKEITRRAEKEKIQGELRPGVYVHADQHCVANRPPKPGRYRMLFATAKTRRRLFRPGDPYHPDREGAKMVPEREELPPAYRYLLDWYQSEYATGTPGRAGAADPILGLRGLGREIWAGEDPDEYVRQLREGWE
jgi:hypothetical protein